MQRTFLVLAFGLLCGGVVGAYATTTVYGKRRAPAPVAPAVCPKCAECVVCPPPVDCAAPPPVVSADSPPGMFAEDDPTDADVDAVHRPGLPASAIGLASQALDREIGACRTSTLAQGRRGTVLLDLTITATGGIGHIAEAEILQIDDDLEVVQDCIIDAAARVQFDWSLADGQSRLRYPIRVP